jgi:hypothetical protein
MVGAWHKPASVRKVQILRDEKTAGCLRRLPDVGVILSCQPFLWNGVGLVVEPKGKIFVQFDSHWMSGTLWTGMSSSADTAAKAMIARTSSSVSVGKSSRISSTLAPSARLAKTVRTVTRVPLITGSPPQTFGSRSICC